MSEHNFPWLPEYFQVNSVALTCYQPPHRCTWFEFHFYKNQESKFHETLHPLMQKIIDPAAILSIDEENFYTTRCFGILITFLSERMNFHQLSWDENSRIKETLDLYDITPVTFPTPNACHAVEKYKARVRYMIFMANMEMYANAVIYHKCIPKTVRYRIPHPLAILLELDFLPDCHTLYRNNTEPVNLSRQNERPDCIQEQTLSSSLQIVPRENVPEATN